MTVLQKSRDNICPRNKQNRVTFESHPILFVMNLRLNLGGYKFITFTVNVDYLD